MLSRLSQIIAISGFIFSIFKMNIGLFIGFFFAGIYLFQLKSEDNDNNKTNPEIFIALRHRLFKPKIP